MPWRSSNSFHDEPGPTPSGLHRILGKAHANAKTQRAIADTAKGRRIKAQQEKNEKGKK